MPFDTSEREVEVCKSKLYITTHLFKLYKCFACLIICKTYSVLQSNKSISELIYNTVIAHLVMNLSHGIPLRLFRLPLTQTTVHGVHFAQYFFLKLHMRTQTKYKYVNSYTTKFEIIHN